jgi:hypothetical protein
VKTKLTKTNDILARNSQTEPIAYIVYFTRKEEDRPNVIRHVWHVRKMSNNYSHSHGEPAAAPAGHYAARASAACLPAAGL